jgi:hypothetical protein
MAAEVANHLNTQKSRSVAQTPHQLSLSHDYLVRRINQSKHIIYAKQTQFLKSQK